MKRSNQPSWSKSRKPPPKLRTFLVAAEIPAGPLIRIDLDCGFPLVAMLTRQACEELDLQPGARVVALVKAPQVHLIPH